MVNEESNMLGKLKIRSEDIAFRSDQLVSCSKCGKANPPNRAGCLYCGSALEFASVEPGAIKLNLRRLETWENGHNVVLTERAAAVNANAVAQYFAYEPEQAERMLRAVDPFPLARLESRSEAELAQTYLASIGIATKVVSDVDLKIGKPNTRLRSIEFLEDAVHLTAFNTGEKQSIKNSDIVLIVAGALIETRTEAIEKRKKGGRQLVDQTATSSDDLLIDIYGRRAGPGWRISSKGFDFSGLGNEKGLLAAENIRRILEKLKLLSPAVRFVDDYRRVIGPLSDVWEIEQTKDFEGLKRPLFGKSGFSSVVRTSNLEQFSKYSRLQQIIL